MRVEARFARLGRLDSSGSRDEDAAAMAGSSSQPRPFAFLRALQVSLAKGVLRRHFIAYLVVVFFTSIYMGVINASQPWVLTNILNIPQDQLGRATSKLLLANEIVLIALVGTFGVLSDRFGRRVVYVGGFVVAALGAALFTHARDLETLIAFRIVCAVGTAALAAMLVAVVADYPDETSRGAANGWQGFIAGLGAFFMFGVLIMMLPKLLADASGPNPDMRSVGNQWFAIIAAIGVVGALLALFLRKEGVVLHKHEKRPLLDMAREAIDAARKDPGVALSYGAAFVSRGDLAVQGTFVALWISRHGKDQGMDGAEVAAAIGAVGMIAPITATLFAPVAGILCDRFSRVGATAAMMLISAVAYNGMLFVTDPLGTHMKAMMALMGVAEIGAFIASQALVSQQAPEQIRGSVTGFFGVCGAVGILVGTVFGGFLFDGVGPASPFVIFGVANVILFVWALVVKQRVRPAALSQVLEPA